MFNYDLRDNISESEELLRRAVNGTRTHDPQLGKLMLYQLSYYRACLTKIAKNSSASLSLLENSPCPLPILSF